jgi:hypothetical protein
MITCQLAPPTRLALDDRGISICPRIESLEKKSEKKVCSLRKCQGKVERMGRNEVSSGVDDEEQIILTACCFPFRRYPIFAWRGGISNAAQRLTVLTLSSLDLIIDLRGRGTTGSSWYYQKQLII